MGPTALRSVLTALLLTIVLVSAPGSAQGTGERFTPGDHSLTLAPVPDHDERGVRGRFPAFPEPGTVTRVFLKVRASHSRPSDLEISLIHPDGTARIVHAPGRDSGENLSLDVPDPDPPAESFQAFHGKPAGGTWTLWVRDLRAGHKPRRTWADLTLFFNPPPPPAAAAPGLAPGFTALAALLVLAMILFAMRVFRGGHSTRGVG